MIKYNITNLLTWETGDLFLTNIGCGISGISFLMSIFETSLERGVPSYVVERSNQLPNWEGNKGHSIIMYCHTADGRNPTPVDMVNIPLFTRFYTSQVVIAGFLNHQQYQKSHAIANHFEAMILGIAAS